MLIFIVSLSTLLWIALLLVPWQPWRTRERLIIEPIAIVRDLSDITVLVPARNEASCIAETLQRLNSQGRFARIVVIDDQSDDATRAIAAQQSIASLEIIEGSSPPAGWSGKLWALEQGFTRCDSKYALLLDADIGLEAGTVSALLAHLHDNNLDMASVMARLHMEKFWEKLLLPPFVYFFKLIYPFALANSRDSTVAAGAGGCVLIGADKLREIGGFSALKDAIIDDCTLAKKVKQSPGRIWIGLSNDARALRPNANLADIWNMVARTAYTQLRYSQAMLLGCTFLLLLSYAVPIAALIFGSIAIRLIAALGLVAMIMSFMPTIRYYKLPFFWALTLPLAAGLFLAMTWTSAFRYSRGERSRWKNRSYARALGADTTSGK